MRKTLLMPLFVLMSVGLVSSSDTVKEKYLRCQGHKVYYEVRGNSPKTLVFIHGWTGSTQSWKYQLNAFPGYKVLAIDLPGNGKSSKNEKAKYTMDLFATAVAKMLEKEHVEKAFVFGHSMGFAAAEVFAQKYPEKCVGIGSIDGTLFAIPDTPKEKTQFLEFNRQFAITMEQEKGREDFINALFLPDTPELLKTEVLENSRQVPLAIGKSMIESIEDGQNYFLKRKSNIPCLAIYSPAYQLPPDYENEFRKIYPQVNYHEVKGVSHFFMLEIPYKTNQIIADYLAKEY
jgi:pimeloyl-ACP methyl ester carboxylesterase